jgi:hypothetical protein
METGLLYSSPVEWYNEKAVVIRLPLSSYKKTLKREPFFMKVY